MIPKFRSGQRVRALGTGEVFVIGRVVISNRTRPLLTFVSYWGPNGSEFYEDEIELFLERENIHEMIGYDS